MWEESLGTQDGVHLIEGVRLIRGPLNTGFTVITSLHPNENRSVPCKALFCRIKGFQITSKFLNGDHFNGRLVVSMTLGILSSFISVFSKL